MRKHRSKLAILLSAAMLAGIVLNAAPIQQTGTLKEAEAASNVLAFPGAVGGGKYATGGRGGAVYHVTNLNDSGTGSFRDAVSQPNRIVVFDVSGTIELQSNILVSSNITIAGQTAPGGSGITLKNYKLGMSGDNIICRYISSRPGPYKSTSSGNDAWGGAKGSNSIIDHCSMSWSTDEQWALYSNNEYYTVQYSVIGPADSWGGHSKGVHGFGIMMGKGNLTFNHNLIVHNVSRNFRGKVVGTETADFTNNVIYDWAYQTAYGTIGHLNYVNNTLKMGNGTTGGYHYISVDSSTSPENFKIYLTGNRMLYKDNTVYSPITDNNWAGVTYSSSIGKNESNTRSDSHFELMVNGEDVSTAVTAESAEDSYEHVITYAGNGISPEKRTAVDQQVAYETETGTGYLSGTAAYSDGSSTDKEKIDSYNIQCGVTYTYPSAVLTKEIVDSDNDGMPDEWEYVRGLNPNDPSDVNGDYCGQGYTNIEYYINDLTVDSFPEGTVTLSPELDVGEIELPEGGSVEVKTTNEVATVTGNTIVFNDPAGHDNGVELENPFIGKDTSNGASISFWFTPQKSVSAGDTSYTSLFMAVDSDSLGTLKYDVEGTRQYADNVTGTKLNYYQTGLTLTAGKEYFVTIVVGGDGLYYYMNGISVGYTGYGKSNESSARTKAMALLSAEGTRLYIGGTVNTASSMQELSAHQLQKDTIVRDIQYYTEAMGSMQVNALYKQEKEKPADTSAADGLTPISAAVKSNDGVAAVTGNTIVFNDPAGHDNGVELENPFIGKDTSNGVAITFWVTPQKNVSAKDYSYSSLITAVDKDSLQTLKYDLEGTRQFFDNMEGAKINYWEASLTLKAGTEYFITYVIGSSGLEYYVNGENIGYTGYGKSNENSARLKAMAFLAEEGTRLFAGGTSHTASSAVDLTKHKLAEGTVIRDVTGYVGELNAIQVKALYQLALQGETPSPTANPTNSPSPTANPTDSPSPTANPTATPSPTATVSPTATAAPTETPVPYVSGDVNSDGKINAEDALSVLKHAARILVLEDETQLKAADVNEDGLINAEDALMILKIAAKLITLD